MDRDTGDLFTPMQPELAGNGDIEITRAQNRNLALATGFHKMAMRSNTWSLFMRYQTQAECQYRRAVEEFERLKQLRPTLPPEPPNEPVSGTEPEETKSPDPPETDPSETSHDPFATPPPQSRTPNPPVKSAARRQNPAPSTQDAAPNT